jgi:hypothetical protein
VLAWLSSWGVRATLNNVIGHSLAATRLVSGFDLGTFFMMVGKPEVQPSSLAPAMVASVLVMLLYLLFIDGGLFTVYLEDRKLSRAEFFESAGLFFWRMFRLALYSLVPFGIVAAVHGGLNGWGGKLSDDAGPERLGFYVQMTGALLAGLMTLLVRLWFDLTQARIVRENERRLLRTLFGTFKLAFSSGLYLGYLGIALVSVAAFLVGGGIWLNLPHAAWPAGMVIWELVVITAIATRLWMKATSARWVSLLPAETLPAASMAFVPPPAMHVPAPEPVVESAPEPMVPPVDEEPPISE